MSKTIDLPQFLELYKKFKSHISRLGGGDAQKVLDCLMRAEKPLSVQEIQDRMKMSQAAVSGILRHFRPLRLVKYEQEGHYRYYTLNLDQMQALLFFMANSTGKYERIRKQNGPKDSE